MVMEGSVTCIFTCLSCSVGHSLPWDGMGQAGEVTCGSSAGVCFPCLTTRDVSFSLAASVPESQESQGPGPVSGAQQVAAGMRSVAPPSCCLWHQLRGTGRHCCGPYPAHYPLSAPLSICRPHGAIEESEHGQRSALRVGQAGVGWAVLWPQSSLSAAGMLLQQAPLLVQLCGEESEGRRWRKTCVDRALLASCVCLLWPQLLTTEATAAVCVKYERKCWVFPSMSPKLCQARGLPDKAASSLCPCPAYLQRET